MLWPIAWFNRKEVSLEPWLFSLHSARLAAASIHVYPVIREEYWHADTMRWDRAQWDKKQNSPTNPLTVMGVHPWGDPNILPKTIPIHSSLRFASYSCFCCIVALGHLWNAIKDNHFYLTWKIKQNIFEEVNEWSACTFIDKVVSPKLSKLFKWGWST